MNAIIVLVEGLVNICYTVIMHNTSSLVRAILFDLDGTLVDTIGDIVYALNTALQYESIAPIDTKTCLQRVGNGLRNLLRLSLQAADRYVCDNRFEQLYKILIDTYHEHPVDHSYVYPGIDALIQKCVAHHLPMGILSNKDDALVSIIVSRFFHSEPFVFVRGAVEGRPLKPSRAAVMEFAELVGLQPDEILLVGDTEVDAATASASGTRLALVGWGFRTAEQLAETGHRPICTTIEMLHSEVFR